MLAILALVPETRAADGVVHHALQVRVDPASHRLEVTDTLTLPDTPDGPVRLWLGSDFEPVGLTPLDATPDGRFRAWALSVPAGDKAITLQYAGNIDNKPRSAEHGMPLAWIDAQGVYLDGAVGWIPRLDADRVTFSLALEGPAEWTWISQGAREADGRHWRVEVPQEDAYLLGGPFARTAQTHGEITLETDLLADDPALAQRYLSVMGGYIDFYDALIGAYPYPRFAVVENRWQTGYGMPGFTLLGSQVLRLPFILHSSLPHEILHNWWGNGVWVDARGGNWSEGLTAYLADHLIKEADGGGPEYRRKLLERYTSFAAQGRDITLRDFRSRHSDATQAVGYGKMLMLFHMQRRAMGDAAFVAALRRLWQDGRFRHVSLDQVATMMGTAGTGPFAPTWLDHSGAPQLQITRLEHTERKDGSATVDLEVTQTQAGSAYPLSVPVTVQLANGERMDTTLPFDGRSARWQATLPARPLRVDVDPQFDVFRRLDPREQPASLGRLFGAPQQWLILPSRASDAEKAAWQALAEVWRARYDNLGLAWDTAYDEVPPWGIKWILGWNNLALVEERTRFTGAGQRLEADAALIGPQRFGAQDSAVVLLDPNNLRPALGFIGAASAEDIAGLARKLTHYATWGRLAFRTGDLTRQVADTLPVDVSPLRRVLGDEDPGPPAQIAAPLADQVKVVLPSQR